MLSTFLTRCLRWCRSHAHSHEEGTTAIEFAFIAPVLMLMMFGIIELSLMMYTQSVMEGATSISSRLGKTGYTESGISREQTIRNKLSARATGLLNVSLFTIQSKSYSQFDTIGEAEPFLDANGNGQHDAGENYTDVNGNGVWDEDMGRAGYGNANDIVVYNVSYPWHVATPLIGRIFGEDGTLVLKASAVVKNEPY